jgi:hypothetical protein
MRVYTKYRLTHLERAGVKFEVLRAVKTPVVVLEVVTPCSLVRGYRRFGGIYSLILRGSFFRNVGSHIQGYTASQRADRKWYGI